MHITHINKKDMHDIVEALKWRYATKRFDTGKKLSRAQLGMLLEAVRLSPSSFGLETWKVIVVEDPEIRTKLRAAGYGQPQITDASHLIVFAVKKDINDALVDRFIALVADTRGVSVQSLKEYGDMIKSSIKGKSPEELRGWAARQAYLALGVLLTTAAHDGIDASPMEGFDAKQFDEIIGLEGMGLESVVILALGFRSEHDTAAQMPKVRSAKEDVVVEVK